MANREMAYHRGYERCIAAKGRLCMNPYPHGTEQADLWSEGWFDALEVVQVQRKERNIMLGIVWTLAAAFLLAVANLGSWLVWLFLHS